MDAFLDAFHVYPGHAVPQHLLRIHGSHRYEYAATLDECAQMCWAHAECAGFVDNRAVHEVGNRPLCIFKSSAAGMTARASKDFYARKSVYEAADHRYVRTPLQLSGFAAPSSSTRHDADAPPVLFTVDNVVSAEEAAQLREAGRRCFSSTPSTASRPSDTDEDDSRVPANLLSSSYFGEEYGCLAGAASPLLSSVERRIASLVGIPPHSEENPLMITAARPHTGRYHVRNLHHDKNNGPERVATVLIYLSNVTDDSHGGHTSFPALLRTDPEARLRTPRGERSGADGHNGTGAALAEAADASHRARLHSAAQALARAYELGATTFVGGAQAERTAASARAAGIDPSTLYRDDALSAELLELAEVECERASSGINLALALRPKLGTALVFHNELGGDREGEGDPRLWHAVCHPRAGASERWALQKFKQRCEGCMEVVVKDEL